MNRNYTQFQLSLEKRTVNLFLKAAIGATGAPTISANLSKGIASIARTGVGAYDITLQDQYVDLHNVSFSLILAAGAPTPTGGCVIRTNSVASTKVIQVLFVDNAGVAVEINSGATLNMHFVLKGSTV